MPNWCSNTLAVHGDKADVEKFMDDVKKVTIGAGDDTTPGLSNGEIHEEALSFERHLPIPRNPDGTLIGEPQNPAPGVHWSGDDNWYDWCCRNWGTKWDACEAYVDTKENGDKMTAFYSFETAWAPPEAWLSHVAPLYPTLSMKMEYREEGMGFAGLLGFHKGEEVENQYWDNAHHHTDVDTYDEMYG